MRKVKFMTIIVAFALLVCLSLGIAACKPKEEVVVPEEPTANERVTANLTEVVEKVSGMYSLSADKPISLDIALTTDNKKGDVTTHDYALNVKGIFDRADDSKSVLMVELKDKLNGKVLLGIYYDKGEAYLDINGDQYKIANTELARILASVVPATPATQAVVEDETMDMIITTLGMILFQDSSVKDNVYTFDFDTAKIGTMLSDILAEFEENVNPMLNFFGIATISELNKTLQDNPMTGKLNINLNSGVSFDIVAQGDKVGNFSMKGDPITVKDGTTMTDEEYTEFAKLFPVGYKEFKSVSMLQASAHGNIELMSGNKSYVNYEWSLESKLDLGKIIVGDPIPEDNYFHFRLSHVCDNNCGDYCASKYRAGDGAILDIGFSPKDFGTEYIYLSVSLQALLGPAVVGSLAPGYEEMITMAVAPYTLITLDTYSLQFKNSAFDATTTVADGAVDIDVVLEMIGNIFSNMTRGEDSVTVNIKDMLTDMEQSPIYDTLNMMLGATSTPLDKIKLSMNDFRYGASAPSGYDVHLETVIKRSDTNTNPKAYDAFIADKNSLALDWEEKRHGNGDLILYSSNRVSNTTAIDMRLTPYQAKDLIGSSYVQYSYQNIYKEWKSSTRAKVVGISGIDYTLIGTPQQVTFMTASPSGYLSDIVKDALAATINLDSLFYETVSGEITLVEDIGFEYKILEEKTRYAVGSTYNNAMEYSITKKIGDNTEVIKGTTWCNSEHFKWADGSWRTMTPGTFTIEYNIAGHKVTRNIVVEDVAKVETNFEGQTSVEVLYDHESKNVPAASKMKLGYATFITADGALSNRVWLDYGQYDFNVYGVKYIVGSDLLSGATTHKVYFNKVQDEVVMNIDLWGYSTVTRTIAVTDHKTTYLMESIPSNKTSVVRDWQFWAPITFSIANKYAGLGTDIANATTEFKVEKVLYDYVQNNGTIAHQLRPAYASEYTLVNKSPNVAIDNMLLNKVGVLSDFRGHSAGKYKITATAYDGTKRLCYASHIITVNEINDAYKGGTVTDKGDLTFEYKSTSTTIALNNIVYILNAVSKNTTGTKYENLDITDYKLSVNDFSSEIFVDTHDGFTPYIRTFKLANVDNTAVWAPGKYRFTVTAWDTVNHVRLFIMEKFDFEISAII